MVSRGSDSRLSAFAKDAHSISAAAAAHGQVRHAQGYSAFMLIEESRVFQVATFGTLHLHHSELDQKRSFNAVPIWLDTDTSTSANTNWRGSSGCTPSGIGSRGFKPTRWHHHCKRSRVFDDPAGDPNRATIRDRTLRHYSDPAGPTANAVARLRCYWAEHFQGSAAIRYRG
jgi:hypothetical protein